MTDDRYDKAVSLMEQDADIRADDLDALTQDAELLDLCRTLSDSASATEALTVDSDAAWARFRQRLEERKADETQQTSVAHDFRRQKAAVVPMGLRAKVIALLAVAAVALALLVWKPMSRKATPDLRQSPIAYTAVRDLQGVTVVNEKGHPMAIAAKRPDGTIDFAEAAKHYDVITVAVPRGDSYSLTLADGTRVWLHANSRLIIPGTFEGDTRQVHLDGEAYFAVAHDADHPFIVQTNGLNTEVRGTEFYVRANGNASDGVTLVQGRVHVSSGDKAADIMPGQQATMAGGQLAIHHVDTEPYLNWRDGYLYFDNTSLEEIIRRIAAEFDYEVEILPGADLKRRVHFVADRRLGIGSVINTLNDMEDMHVSLSDKKIIAK